MSVTGHPRAAPRPSPSLILYFQNFLKLQTINHGSRSRWGVKPSAFSLSLSVSHSQVFVVEVVLGCILSLDYAIFIPPFPRSIMSVCVGSRPRCCLGQGQSVTEGGSSQQTPAGEQQTSGCPIVERGGRGRCRGEHRPRGGATVGPRGPGRLEASTPVATQHQHHSLVNCRFLAPATMLGRQSWLRGAERRHFAGSYLVTSSCKQLIPLFGCKS